MRPQTTGHRLVMLRYFEVDTDLGDLSHDKFCPYCSHVSSVALCETLKEKYQSAL